MRTSASRETQIAFTSWLATRGMCTDGRSIRHEASLNVRASPTSFFSPRCPTPSVRTSVAGTTRTSCPCCRAAPASRNASVQVSTITLAEARVANHGPSARVGRRASSRMAPSLLRTHT